MVLSFINAGILSDTMLPVALGLALAHGGILQLLVGMWAFVVSMAIQLVFASPAGGPVR